MVLTNKHLSRRTLLRGLGVALALPHLEAMTPARGGAGKTPLRLGFVYVPNGIIMPEWTPAETGRGFALSPVLKPLEAHRERMLVLSGLAQVNGRALGDGAGDHARAAASYLTGFHPKKTEGADIRNGISVDQVAAQAIGGQTRFPSLELGLEGGGMVGGCDSGYSCAYSNSLAWSGPQTPLPPEINPRAVFERLFGDGEPMDEETRQRQSRQNRSLLDFVREEAGALSRELGQGDRHKLDEYLTSVREIERRIQIAETQDVGQQREVMQEITLAKPAGVPVTFEAYSELMFDLMVAAWQTQSTRVITMMVGREGSNRTYGTVGVPEAHHGLSHHMRAPEKIEKLARINHFHVTLFERLVAKMAETRDGDGTLLDHSLIVYGSGLSDGNAHSHHDLPVLLVGGANGAFKTGRHVEYPKETPMNNLFLSILDTMGVEAESLGDSTGRLEYLSDLTA
ncbi:MAG TPA: DUF1552 domain-containing protein [Bryobacteraceae bacterium]|nr:hypothetical protein [Bryobacterales bacterium]HRJ20651.1 DUF1552 domain-containing protein [Bryobacteraceae bacterium]